jgi:pSer/pThr/pTyr-binding forkhead associated (FHA) protein
LFALILYSSARAQSNTTTLITTIDAERFPDVLVGFRAVDSAGNAVAGLDSTAVDVYENGVEVADFRFTDTVNGPANVIFVVDLGQHNGTMSAATRRATLLQFATDHFRDGVDTAAIVVPTATGNSTTILSPTSSREAFIQAVNVADLAHDNALTTRGLAGVERAIELIDETTDPDLSGTAIIYLTDSIFATRPGFGNIISDAQDLNATARSRHIPLYVFQTDNDNSDALDDLVANTGGARLRVFDDPANNRANLTQVYSDILARGLVYQGAYRSTGGESGDRRVTVLPAGTPLPGPEGSTASFSVELAPPTLAVTSPADGARFTRTATRENGAVVYDLDSIDVTAELSEWPDELPRRLVSAELLVNGTTALTIQPDPEATRFTFPWDISDIRVEGVNTQTLQVRTRDELGLESTSPTVTVQIVVTPPPPLPTPIPEVIAPPVVAPVDPCAAAPDGRECLIDRAVRYGPWIALAILAVVFLLMLRRLNQAIAVARQSPGTFRDKVTEVRRTLLGGGGRSKQDVLARLHVLTARPDLIDQVIELDAFKKTIGRDPRLSDIQLYNESDRSSVSGQHCTIQYDRANKVFMLTDNNSSNGTTINNRPINADDPIPLGDGDVIVLGNLFQQGAKLRFELVKTEPDGVAADDAPAAGSVGVATETGDEFEFNIYEDGDMTAGNPTLLDIEADVIDIVPPDQGNAAPKKDDRRWLEDLE